MRQIAPDGPVYQAGTLAGNPLAVAAGLTTLRHLHENPGFYEELEAMGQKLEDELGGALAEHGVAGCVTRVGAMMTIFFGPTEVRSWDDATGVDRERFSRFFHAAYDNGVLIPPSPFEALFLMGAHHDVVGEVADALVTAIADIR